MTEQPIFYKKPVPLSQDKHGKLRVSPNSDFGFARGAHAIGLAAVEFSHAAREYPIVFGGEDENIYPIAVLGLRQGENLFVTDNGQWDGRYIPAYVRRYPFILGSGGEEEVFSVLIDEDFAGWNKKKGEALFQADGSHTEFLDKSLEFLKDFHGQHERTREFCQHLKALDLFEPMQANISLNSGENMALTGFQVISRAKLNALDPDKLAGMAQTGQLELAYLHLFSLGNFSRLLELGQTTEH